MSVLKMSKYLVFFIRTSDEYLRRYGKGSVVKTDPYKYLVKYSPDIFKKKASFKKFQYEKKMFYIN